MRQEFMQGTNQRLKFLQKWVHIKFITRFPNPKMVDYILCCKCSKRLYIFKGEKIKDIYIEHCKVGTLSIANILSLPHLPYKKNKRQTTISKL